MKNVLRTGMSGIALTLMLTACGGSSESANGNVSRPSAARGMPAECPQPPFDFEIRRNGSGANEVFHAVGAQADMQLELRSYKLYLTDYELDPKRGLLSQVMDKPPGGTAIQVAIQTDYGSSNVPSVEDWKPLQTGDLALHINDSRDKYGKPDGKPIMTFSIATDQGPTGRGTVEMLATATVLYVGEDGICLEVQATSESGIQMSGVVAGAVG